MQINISNEELKAAVCDWMRSRGIGTKGETLTVELVSGRGTKGITGSVEISEAIKAPKGTVTRTTDTIMGQDLTVTSPNPTTTTTANPLFDQPIFQDADDSGESPEAE